jgi:hypothetical protein
MVHPTHITDIDVCTCEHSLLTPCILFTTILPQFTPALP